jgi:hypothetical protein
VGQNSKERAFQETVNGLGKRVKTAVTFAGTPMTGEVVGAFRSTLGYAKVTVRRDDTGVEQTFHAHDLCREDLNVG